MKILHYTVNDLQKKLHESDFWSTDILPITKHRALSHIHNPRAHGDDAVLFVGYNNGDIIGYLGVLPDKIYLEDKAHTMAWGSTLWVDPKHRGNRIGQLLVSTASQYYDICSSGVTWSGKMVADTSGNFMTLKTSKGVAFLMRSCCSYVLPKQFKRLRRIRPAFTIIDRTVNNLVELYSFFGKRGKTGFRPGNIEFITEIDEQTDRFIRQHNNNALSKRTAQELNWIIKYPWIIPAPRRDTAQNRYFFSSTSPRFFYLNVKVFDVNGNMAGFVMFKVKDNILSIPFAYFTDEAIDDIIYLICSIVFEMKIDIFITYQNEIIEKFSTNHLPYLYKKDLTLLYHKPNKLKDFDFSRCVFQDGEGDSAFT
ncbi:MAG TPA: GNAT family N-acetyltransferase [Deltaproteobacteria bacterium]|nr:GNAT family N-acetyltransferase [Deltaproteobacteria bacterium]HPJ94474.1 GNAT family N-acetyltransferase [Deltaproteobacteria bacterium]